MIYLLGLIGIAAFAITGVMAAGKKGMDILSITLLGVVTALGGGTLRDIILDSNPIFWVADLYYLWVSVAASIVAFFLVRFVSHVLHLLLFIDALLNILDSFPFLIKRQLIILLSPPSV